jgi:ERF superfamily
MRLNEIQQKLKAPKSQYNSFGKYHYRNAEDILEAVKPLLGDSVLTLSDEIINVGERYYVRATAEFYEAETSKQALQGARVTAFAREGDTQAGMAPAQITGAASSYARKYALNGLFLIDDTKDADSDETPSQPSKTAPTATKAPRPTTELKAAKERTQTLLKLLGHKALKTKKDYEDMVMFLTDMPLSDENIEKINEELSAKLEAKEAME